uniref:RRM domain-containing protein n=1 Tax=Manihot esculenta TaxID=3983 RepID=A0A2C9WPK8_MANES
MSIGKVIEECMKVIAFWMWLDSQGFQNIITNLSSHDDQFLSFVYDEAVSVLSSLQANSTPSPNAMLNTLTLAQRFLSPSVILSDKEEVLKSITDIYTKICCVLFEDFLKEKGTQLGMRGEEETTQKITEWHGTGHNWKTSYAVSSSTAHAHAHSNLNPSAKEWNPINERLPEEDRCLFLTFSNGYPLTENQIINFFSSKHGPCVERVYVHRPYDPRNESNEPPLFGKIVFKTYSVAAMILNGRNEAKFWVDGKPLWCKRFNPEKKMAGN